MFLIVGPSGTSAHSSWRFGESLLGVRKTDPVRFKWGFGEGLLKNKFAFFEASKNPIPERRKLLAKRPFL